MIRGILATFIVGMFVAFIFAGERCHEEMIVVIVCVTFFFCLCVLWKLIYDLLGDIL